MHGQALIIALSIYLGLGIGAGFLSGLLGAGGGLVMVPGMMLAFRFLSVNPAVMMHLAVGTSLASMIPISARSLLSHTKQGTQFYFIYKKMLIGILAGVIGGGILAHFVHSLVLQILFGVFVLTMAYIVVERKMTVTTKTLPGTFGMATAGIFIGMMSGMLGVGGSAFTIPFLVRRNIDMRVAVTTSVAIALTGAVVGAAVFLISGIHARALPSWTTGYVLWPAFLGMVVGGVLIAPVGAKVSHHLSERTLKICFAIFLVAVSIHMLWI